MPPRSGRRAGPGAAQPPAFTAAGGPPGARPGAALSARCRRSPYFRRSDRRYLFPYSIPLSSANTRRDFPAVSSVSPVSLPYPTSVSRLRIPRPYPASISRRRIDLPQRSARPLPSAADRSKPVAPRGADNIRQYMHQKRKDSCHLHPRYGFVSPESQSTACRTHGNGDAVDFFIRMRENAPECANDPVTVFFGAFEFQGRRRDGAVAAGLNASAQKLNIRQNFPGGQKIPCCSPGSFSDLPEEVCIYSGKTKRRSIEQPSRIPTGTMEPSVKTSAAWYLPSSNV